MFRSREAGFRIVVLTLSLIGLLALFSASYAQEGGTIVVDPSAYNYGDAVVNVQTISELIEISNSGPADLAVDAIQMVGPDADDFWIGFATWPFVLPPGESQSIVVSFTPSSEGPKSATLQIESDAQNGPTTEVSLSGNGLGLSVLGEIVAEPVPSNDQPLPNQLVTVAVTIDMTGAAAPADLLTNYQASLAWDPDVLTFFGFFLGDDPWKFPASVNTSSVTDGYVEWFDVDINGVGGEFVVIKFIFHVVGNVNSGTTLDLEFSRMEGEDVEDLLPILTIIDSDINQVGGEETPPDIALDPASHDFGTVPVGSTASHTFTVSNEGEEDLTVSAVSLEGLATAQFSINSGNGPFTLASGESQEIEVSLAPNAEGLKIAALVIESNDPDEGQFLVPLLGSASAPDIAVSPASLSYGNVTVGASISQTLTISNEGNAPLHLSLFGLDGHENQFSYDSNNLAILEAGESGEVVMYFHPSSEGAKSATFVIHSNDPDEVAVEVPLTGVGAP